MPSLEMRSASFVMDKLVHYEALCIVGLSGSAIVDFPLPYNSLRTRIMNYSSTIPITHRCISRR